MSFTLQELQGGKSYSNCTLIGNWYESRCLQEERRNAFKQQRANGSLCYLKTHQRIATALQPQQATKVVHRRKEEGSAPLKETQGGEVAAAKEEVAKETDEAGPFLKSGAILGMFSPVSRRLLSVLPVSSCLSYSSKESAAAAGASGLAVAAKPSPAVWRNSFVIEAAKEREDPFLRYGVALCIRTNDRPDGAQREFLCCPALPPPGVERSQQAFWGPFSSDATWIIETADKTYRYELQGEKIDARVPFVLRHCNSGQCLSVSTARPLYGDFGEEFMVTACEIVSPSLLCLTESFQQGKWTPDEPSKQPGESNVWLFADAGFFEACA